MTALFISCPVRERNALIGILFSLMFWVYPETLVLASGDQDLGQNQPIVFEVKNPISNIQPSAQSLQIAEIAENDPLVNNLKIYLEKHRSPLAVYAPEIVKQPQWQRALAISWVESNFGRFCFDNNCSGIGVKPGHPAWRKYQTKLDWFEDLSQVLARPIYSEKYATCRKMKGIYVQPGTENWVRGCEQKLNEFIKLTQESENQRVLISQKQTQKQVEKLALATFPSVSENQ